MQLRHIDISAGTITFAKRLTLVLFGIGAGWMLLDRMAERDRADVRHAFDQRVQELIGRALMPGSPLGCLEAEVAEAPLQAFCEQAVFAGPDTVAAATAYVTASLSLLADGVANGVDGDYNATFAALRRRLQADRFGFVARALTAQGCTAERCEAFALFGDTRALTTNLVSGTFDVIFERHAAGWPQPTAPVVSSTAAAQSGASGSGRTVGIDFPSAASIPPVSIMTEELKEPAKSAGETSPQKLTPPPVRPNSRAAAPATPPQTPIQVSPPAANAGGVKSPPQ